MANTTSRVITKSVSSLLRETPYKPFTGVLEQYISWALGTIQSEGKQAVDRLKAYMQKARDCVSAGDFKLPSRKFSHLRPVIGILKKMVANGDYCYIFIVMTALRCYDTYLPTKRDQQREYLKFQNQFLSSTSHVGSVPDTFDLQTFWKFLDLIIPELKHQVRSRMARPVEGSIMMARKGTVRIPNPMTGRPCWLPSITGAKYELAGYELLNPTLLGQLEQFANYFGNPFGYSFKRINEVVGYTDWWVFMKDHPGLIVANRRNALVPSPGGKVRVIGIADYPTQYALSCLHDTMMNVLRSMPTDYTRSHDDGFGVLNSLTKNHYVRCFDLTSATDAFPASLQSWVLSKLFSYPVGQIWWNIMTQVPFLGPEGDPHQTKFYKVGQPMGLLSSWPVFAFCHHLMVAFAYYKAYGIAKTPWSFSKEDYGIVGDDIFICDIRTSTEYAMIMSSLGVTINMKKSLTRDINHHVTEFVKRNSYDGQEISALSPNLFKSIDQDYAALQRLVELLNERFPSFPINAWLDTFEARMWKYSSSSIRFARTIPLELGGLRINSETSLAPPNHLLSVMLHRVSLAVRRHYRGSFFDRKTGRLLVDELTAANGIFNETVVDTKSDPVYLYNRYQTETIETEQKALKGQLFGIVLNLRLASSSDEIISSKLYNNFIRLIKESDVPFYMASRVNHTERNRLYHRFGRIARCDDFSYFERLRKRTEDDKRRNDKAAQTLYDALFGGDTFGQQPESINSEDTNSKQIRASKPPDLTHEFPPS